MWDAVGVKPGIGLNSWGPLLSSSSNHGLSSLSHLFILGFEATASWYLGNRESGLCLSDPFGGWFSPSPAKRLPTKSEEFSRGRMQWVQPMPSLLPSSLIHKVMVLPFVLQLQNRCTESLKADLW